MTQAEIDVARLVLQAREVCAAAYAEGWLTSQVVGSSPLRQAVRRLADLLGEEDSRHGVPTVDDLVSFACAVSDDGHRASALSDLVPYVDEVRLSTLLAAGHAIDEEYQRCRAFMAVAPRASAGSWPAWLPPSAGGRSLGTACSGSCRWCRTWPVSTGQP